MEEAGGKQLEVLASPLTSLNKSSWCQPLLAVESLVGLEGEAECVRAWEQLQRVELMDGDQATTREKQGCVWIHLSSW